MKDMNPLFVEAFDLRKHPMIEKKNYEFILIKNRIWEDLQ